MTVDGGCGRKKASISPASELKMRIKKSDNHKILIVDDDEDILVLLAKWLGDAGFETIVSSSGEDAYLKIAEVCPSLVITDLFIRRS
jgi:CheY-like chemotaxis protein